MNTYIKQEKFNYTQFFHCIDRLSGYNALREEKQFCYKMAN